MKTKSFIKNKEDFICENCGFKVIGDGYTNHCPECLFSKHVDINPGDRAESCKGLMRPIKITGTTNNLILTHRCDICGFERNNKVQEGDNMNSIINLMKILNSQK